MSGCKDRQDFRSQAPGTRKFREMGLAGKVALLAAFFAAVSAGRADAGALDWLSQKTGKTRAVRSESVVVERVNSGDLEQNNITGNSLDSYQFAQSHFSSSKVKLEKACRAISSRYNDASVRDILQKLFIIDTQLFKESIKNSALAVREIMRVNDSLTQGIQDLNRVVTAPGQETLDSLDKTIDKVGAANLSQTLLVKKYLAGAERTLQMSQTGYETLELIPSLSITGLDLLVQMSKQMMRMNQSNAEAFKGLLLNVQSSTEMVSSGLESIKKTVRETLRFSDHFAVKQFPLINLPAPSREKIYVTLNSVANSVKGVENTVSIGDSQVRNTAQQFTHLTGGFIAKAAEALKYQSEANGEKALEQISTYARNQVSGLFLRVKEDIGQMRTEMARVARSSASSLPPAVNFESRDEYASRRAQSASSQKLPLFLLGKAVGGESVDIGAAMAAPAPGGAQTSPAASGEGFIALKRPASASLPVAKGSTQVLYSEGAFADEDNSLMQPEMNILTKELGSDFFFGDSGENRSEGSVMARGGELPAGGDDLEMLPDEQNSEEMQMSYSNLNDAGAPEIEMLRMDSGSDSNDGDELIPMMRYDSDALNLDE